MTEREGQSLECLRIARVVEDFKSKINYTKKSLRYNKYNIDSMIYLAYLTNPRLDDFETALGTILNELDLNSEDFAKTAITYARCLLMRHKNRQVIEILGPILDELNAKDYLLWAYLSQKDYEKAVNIYYEFFMDENILYLAGIMYLFYKKDHLTKASAYFDRIRLMNPYFFPCLLKERKYNHEYHEAYSNIHHAKGEFASYTIDTFYNIIKNDVNFIEFVKSLM